MRVVFSIVLLISVEFLVVLSQSSRGDVADLFYDANFNGPLFDQPVYTVTTPNFTISSPINTTLFIFNLQPQSIFTLPSYVLAARSLNNIAKISVTLSDSTFRADFISNFTYRVVNNISPLNYFSPYHRYVFYITATQFFPDRPSTSSTAIAQIDLVNCNVYAPLFIIANPTFSISGAASVGAQFGTVFATDADNDSITFSISPPSIQFSIDPYTGVLRLDQALQAVTSTPLIFNVTATDDASSCSPTCSNCRQLTSTTTITIDMQTANTQAPRFLNQLCGSTFSLLETSQSGTNITTIAAVDNDLGNSGQIMFYFPSVQTQTIAVGSTTTTYSKFQLLQYNQTNNIRIAQLQTSGTFSYSSPGATRVWYLSILATDLGTPSLQSICTVRINLIEANIYAPVFTITQWNITIYNASNPALIRIIAYDADLGTSGTVDYYIGTLNVPYFTINQTTGAIIYRAGVTFSNLNTTLFPVQFTVFAQDRGIPPRISPVNATITLYLDTSNVIHPAVWLNPTSGELNIVISEEFFAMYPMRPVFDNNRNFNGSIIYQLNLQSPSLMIVSNPFPSTSMPFSAITPTTNNNIFTSGISVTSSLDAEVQDSYLLQLFINTNPSLSGWTKITLSDENNKIPTFSFSTLDMNILGDQVGLRAIAQIPAFDRDLTYPNNFVQYSINQTLNGAMVLNQFFIDNYATIWTNSTFDLQNQSSYRIIITAYDGASAWSLTSNGSSNMQNFQLNLFIVGNNNNQPNFNQTVARNISIIETTTNGTGILNLTVYDLDVATVLNIGILSGNAKNAFLFEMILDNSDDPYRTEYQAICQLSVVATLDYEYMNLYTLVLFASDSINLATINISVNLLPNNSKAPVFNLQPGTLSYQYVVNENEAVSILNGNSIVANDANIPATPLVFSIIPTGQEKLTSLYLTQSNNTVTISIGSPGLVRDPPFGYSIYNFSIRATDQNGTGVSTYVPVSITVLDINNKGPIPTNSPWIMNEGILNPSILMTFTDFDDYAFNNTVPFTAQVISPPQFMLIPTLSFNGTFTLQYNGILSRTVTKNVTVTMMGTDVKQFSVNTSIPIIVGDVPNNDPISNGLKTITIIYVNNYQESLQSVNLGSVYVVNSNDWFLAANGYSVLDVSNGQTFNVYQGFLSTPTSLYPGSYTVRIQVIKNLASGQSTAISTINIGVRSIDSEFVRQASTIRIQGETPESLIDPTLGNRLSTLLNALASILGVSSNSIIILAIRPVLQYRNPIYPPLPLDQAKQAALTDVVFYLTSLTKEAIENTIDSNLSLFSSSFGITATASGPNLCINYACPFGTICRLSRSMQSLPFTIDTNLTSFVGINIIDSPDCVNATWTTNPPSSIQSDCITYSFNNATHCPCTSLQSLAPLGPYCEVLGLTFSSSGGGSYAVFDGTKFSNLAPARFSFDFTIQDSSTIGVILLYGLDTSPISDYFWIAVEIVSTRSLRFHFRDDTLTFDTVIMINASIWYHIEYEYVDSTILIMVNDEQYVVTVNNNSININNQSFVQLYLGGLPMTNSLVAALYSALSSVNTFRGCIRNVLSNGFYLDMNNPLASNNSNSGPCDCSITNSCKTTSSVATGIIVPWYVWLIIALVLLLIGTMLVVAILTCFRHRRLRKARADAYMSNIENDRDNDKDTTGEEDNLSYNLSILKKPIYTLSDEKVNSSMWTMIHRDRINSFARAPFNDYVNRKLSEQLAISLADDTQKYYADEGDSTLAYDLSSINSSEY
ncbi:unnamed protein product [Rotaria magnacalcarata]|uniref:Cadherin domain-containing protein n=3 Tax=Rotaria magnacalcarata TaxID=392030 RepID=A0A819S0D1_9BILA|nr:unnamed protein product [Rotaria magnacalcarata]CAF4053916.1 unnamed protein product [Rotaria magnacalcarata]